MKKEAKTDFAYLIRLNADKTSQIKIINLDEIIKNPASPNNFTLRAEDELAIFEQERFARKDFFSVGGFVRSPSRVPYDVTKSIKIKDAINLAGGTLPQATNFAYLIRRDSLNSKNLEYLRINLQVALSQPNSPDNLTLQPNDSIYVQSKEDFIDDGFIRVSGAVRKPGEYRFARTLKLNDVITLANGFKLEAAPAKVEIFRVVIEDNKPVRTIAATIPIDRDLNIAQTEFELMPYDQIVVRTAPQFSLQKFVVLTGEVNYPGEYALLSVNEKLLSVITRAGNFAPEAFPQGATLYRRDDNVGYIVVDLKKALADTASAQNLILKQGDIIDIPKAKDIVTIQGATKAFDLYPDKILQNGKVNVAFEGRRSAWYYVDKHAAGVGKRGKKKTCFRRIC
ncbi:MAG: hypothetical protein HC817_07765 [Saprospiraceae bacterium]|nr:hypothetical protein [Saprospiraceae bacterium]